MSERRLPKVLLFDIGGVCVVSPFQAILDYERANSIPPGYINFCISRASPSGAWQRLERGEMPLDSTYYREFKADLERPHLWEEYYRKAQSLDRNQSVPPVPDIDAEKLFVTMMTISREPDRFMFPALKKLKAFRKFHLAALSNNVIFPAGHVLARPLANPDDDVRAVFEIFVGSSAVGMRKPDRDIYEYTLAKMRREWGEDLRAEDVVFLDDIGQNLKMARSLGMRTIRVVLGKTDDAVRELEEVTGLKLLEQPPDGARAKQCNIFAYYNTPALPIFSRPELPEYLEPSKRISRTPNQARTQDPARLKRRGSLRMAFSRGREKSGPVIPHSIVAGRAQNLNHTKSNQT